MSYTLAVAAAMGDSHEVKKMLQKEEIRRLINTPDMSGRGIPLYYACGGSKLELGHYKTMILLLEAGANPLIVQPNMYLGCPPTSPLLSILSEGNLAVLRLMMWYVPDYEKVEMQSERGMLTIIERAKIQDGIEVEKDKSRGVRLGARDFSAHVKEVGDDAKKVRTLKAEAAELATVARAHKERAEYKLAAKKYSEAAQKYEEAAKIYEKHEKLEDTLVYYPTYEWNASPKEYRPIFKEHYQNKQRECLKQLYEWYKIIDKNLSSLSDEHKNADDKACHTNALDRLIQLSRLFEKDKSIADDYLHKAIRVRAGLPMMVHAEPTPPRGGAGGSPVVDTGAAFSFRALFSSLQDYFRPNPDPAAARVDLPASASKEDDADDTVRLLTKPVPVSPPSKKAGAVVSQMAIDLAFSSGVAAHPLTTAHHRRVGRFEPVSSPKGVL